VDSLIVFAMLCGRFRKINRKNVRDIEHTSIFIICTYSIFLLRNIKKKKYNINLNAYWIYVEEK